MDSNPKSQLAATPEELVALFETQSHRLRSVAAKYFVAPGQEEIRFADLSAFLDELSSRCGNFDFRPAIPQSESKQIAFPELLRRLRSRVGQQLGPNTPSADPLALSVRANDAGGSKPSSFLLPPPQSKDTFSSSTVTKLDCVATADMIEEQLRQAIARYEGLLKLEKEQGKDTGYTQRLLGMMRNQFEAYKESQARRVHPGIKLPDEATTKEKRGQGLKEIFAFYCKQQMLLGQKPTFDRLTSALSHMTLGEFTRFCRDFGLPLSAGTIKQIYKKKPYHGRDLDWDMFYVFQVSE